MKTRFKGVEVDTAGNIPEVGAKAFDFLLVGENLEDVSLSDFKGKTIVLNIFPSLDTSVCAMSVRHFNKMAAEFPDTKVLCISKDLPFAQKRFCVAEGLENVETLSDIRPESNFGVAYGVRILNGTLRGLFARAVVVISKFGVVTYSSMNSEIAEEPDYDAIIKAVARS